MTPIEIIVIATIALIILGVIISLAVFFHSQKRKDTEFLLRVQEDHAYLMNQFQSAMNTVLQETVRHQLDNATPHQPADGSRTYTVWR